jgi:hypothetical protein
MFHETPGRHENPNKTAQLRGFIVSQRCFKFPEKPKCI